MSLFGNITTAGVEKSEDRLGGGYAALETDVYTGKIEMAYLGSSASGAKSLTLILKGGDFGDREYRETIYFTSSTAKGGNNYYEKDGRKNYLPGYLVADHIAQVTVGKTLTDLAHEEKMVKIYDADQKKEVPKSVPVLVELLGQDVSVAIQKSTENKSEKVGDKYVPTAETRDVNNIDKVFNTQHRMTVAEAIEKQKDASFVADFWDRWVERNKGKTRDKTDKNVTAGSTGKSGAPQGGAGNAGGGAPRSSLFGG